jgi:hypothetical protein
VDDSLLKRLAKPAPQLTAESLLGVLRRGPVTEQALAERFGVPQLDIVKELYALRESGAAIHNAGETWAVTHQPAPPATEFVYESRPDNTFKFGVSSDQHLCSKYERLDVLNDLYDWFEEQEVDRVLNAGNWIDGDDLKNQHDVAVWGFEPQVDYLVAHYPQRRGIATYAVWGEDHEGWYSRREALDVGRFVERRFRDSGRSDWHDLGFMEAGLTLQNANSGAVAPPLVVMHPGGGSSYAVSYRPQKIVESLQGGEKPSVLLIGHYHKLSFNLFRSIWCIQCGCTQDQTPFMRKKGLEAHMGGLVVTLRQDPETGAIVGCDISTRQYFNKGYSNNRWSRSGPVARPEKERLG